MSPSGAGDLPVLAEPPVLPDPAGAAAALGSLPGVAPADVAGRIGRLRAAMAAAGTEALLVSALANVRYCTGFTGSAGLLVVEAERATLLTDGRYRTQVVEQLAVAGLADAVEPVVSGAQGQRDALRSLVGGPGRRLGVEAEHLSWASVRRWSDLLDGAELVPTEGVVEGLRQVKDAGELAAMAVAAAVADAALAEVLPLLAPGRTEVAVARELDAAMRRLGAEDRAFETIVASGPNAAKPHARPTDRALRVGDPVVVDFGATRDGYRSDMTRTFVVGGEPDEALRTVYRLVQEAQSAGVGSVRPGVTTGDVDAACRDRIAAAGYGDAFEHGTGHGVGLDIHEAPSVSAGAAAILEPGVVVTVEPGVYLPGTGGVRIEDTVVVTETGCRPLTRFPKAQV